MVNKSGTDEATNPELTSAQIEEHEKLRQKLARIPDFDEVDNLSDARWRRGKTGS